LDTNRKESLVSEQEKEAAIEALLDGIMDFIEELRDYGAFD
jgi:hypothetical protein